MCHESQKEDTVTLYVEAIKAILERWATDDLIAETDDDVMQFAQALNKLCTKYADTRWDKALHANEYTMSTYSNDLFLEVFRSPWGIVSPTLMLEEERCNIQSGAPCDFIHETTTWFARKGGILS